MRDFLTEAFVYQARLAFKTDLTLNLACLSGDKGRTNGLLTLLIG